MWFSDRWPWKGRELRRFPQCGWNCHVLASSNLCEQESLGVFAPEAINWPLLLWNAAKTCWKFGPLQGLLFGLRSKSQVEASSPHAGSGCARFVLFVSYAQGGCISWLEGLHLAWPSPSPGNPQLYICVGKNGRKAFPWKAFQFAGPFSVFL